MTEQVTSEVYYGQNSVGDTHWVSGQAYPPGDREHYHSRRVMDFRADAEAVYYSSAPGSESYESGWGVFVSPLLGEAGRFTITLTPEANTDPDARYDQLVKGIEGWLGYTGLKILAY